MEDEADDERFDQLMSLETGHAELLGDKKDILKARSAKKAA